MLKVRKVLSSLVVIAVLCLLGCSSANCPLSTTVGCNYGFYDVDGMAVSLSDAVTVSTLLPGNKTVYIYRRLGETSVTLSQQDSSYIEAGYSESVATVRNDTVLVNKAQNRSSLQIPMSFHSGCDTLIFAYQSISNCDTIYIEHDSFTYVELPECGSHRFHTIKSVRCSNTAAISNIKTDNTNVNYEGIENVQIFFNNEAQ